MATYEQGDSDEEVGQIQRKLGIEADDEFGPKTKAAVKAWQKAHGAKADGMIGPDMLLELGLIHLIILENGDEGQLVRRAQSVVGVRVDGEYGNKTEQAVRNYQMDNGLKASGSADVNTLRHMGLLPGRDGRSRAPARQVPARPSAHAKAQHPPAPKRAPMPPLPAQAPGPIASWAYQLADIKPKQIAALDVDLVVIDYAADGDEESAFTPSDVRRMAARPGGGSKKVICYMSIGEAEDYRFYWQKAWNSKKLKKATKAKQASGWGGLISNMLGTGASDDIETPSQEARPAWLDDENPEWGGNYKVRYWDPDWQAVILGKPDAYLDRIIAAGFDGVYLDIIDAFEYWRDEKHERPTADKDMIDFVIAIAKYARARRPDFMVIPQNGEELLADPRYRNAISAQAKEDIFYGIDGDGEANDQSAIDTSLKYLRLARQDGIPIIAVEYLDDEAEMHDARQRLEEAGCCAYFGPRDLDKIETRLA